MKAFRRTLSVLLSICMVATTMIPAFASQSAGQAQDSADTTSVSAAEGYDKSIVMVDAGRKYFSVDSLKSIMDSASAAGMHYVMLGLGNDGLRFLLDDMTLTVGDTTYTSEQVTSAIHAGNEAYSDFTVDELTESDMDQIFSYAAYKGMEIIPLVNTPGHMDAILDAAEALTDVDCAYGSSQRTIDVANETATAFTQALLQKYITYFAGKGCTLFNMGCDEFANDDPSVGMGFNYLVDNGQYGYFVTYVNEVAAMIKKAGMTPMAFNDGIYYDSNTSFGTFDQDIIICYWSSGWWGYDVAKPAFLEQQGHKLVNTHGDWYWIVGGNKCSVDKASQFDINTFMGGTVDDPVGAMFCIWSDYPQAETDESVAQQVADVIAAFGATLPETPARSVHSSVESSTAVDQSTSISVSAPGVTSVKVTPVENATVAEGYDAAVAYEVTVNDGAYTDAAAIRVPYSDVFAGCSEFVGYADGDAFAVTLKDGYFEGTVPHFSTITISGRDARVTPDETITLTVGESQVVEMGGSVNEDYDKNVVLVMADTEPDYQQVHVTCGSITEEDTYDQWVQTEYYCLEEGVYYPLYVKLNIDYFIIWPEYTYSWGYLLNGEIQQFNATNNNPNSTPNVDVYEQVETTPTITFTGVTPGTTDVTVDGAVYRVIVNPFTGNDTESVILNQTQQLSASGLPDGASLANYRTQDATYVTVSVDGVVTAEAEGSTTVTADVVKNGAVVGSYTWTVTVMREDLSRVEPISVEYWITNRPVTSGGGTSETITAAQAYGESGTLISGLVPQTGVFNGNSLAYWKTTRLDASHHQTQTSGDDDTMNGFDFTYIRYWNGEWSYSADRSQWYDVETGDQIVAYYLLVSQVTSEITTQVADWGNKRDAWSPLAQGNYVLVDYSVKYESNVENPSAFPTDNTIQFHCDPADTNTVHQSNRTYYRSLGLIRGVETKDYEVYMITLTPTSDNPNTELNPNIYYVNSYNYAGTEVVAWAENEEVLENSELPQYSSISGKYTCRIGGDPVVTGLDIYNHQGMKVTYYVRAKQTEDSLTVHYIDRTVGEEEFYKYNIAVTSGTTFDPNFGLENGELVNNTVVNIKGIEDIVKSDLSELAEIGANYRYSDYECVDATRSADGKEVYLYYTFKNSHAFVVDFGLPLNIQPSDLGLNSTGWTKAEVSKGVYGNATVGVGQGLTYTPTKTMDGWERLELKLSDADSSVTHTIYLIPATLLYYEANSTFCTFTGNWSFTPGTDGMQKVVRYASDSNIEQLRQAEPNYGYDAAYDQAGSYDVATAAKGADTVSFSFAGTGVDIYADTVTDGAYVMIWVKNASGSTEKIITTDTSVKSGDSDVTTYVDGYKSAVIASIDGLSDGTHTVDIRIIKAGTFNFAGFRVHNPIVDNANIQRAYEAVSEDNPSYVNLRNGALATVSIPDGTVTSDQVFDNSGLDGTISKVLVMKNSDNQNLSDEELTDLLNNGPKNELFVTSDYSVTFTLDTAKAAQIGLHSATGEPVIYKINNGLEQTLNSTLDMFYDLPESLNGTYTITVTSGVLSITEIKVTGSDSANVALAPITREAVANAMLCMGYQPEPVKADASLTIQVKDLLGRSLGQTALTYTGEEGESHTFTKDEIKQAVAAYAQEKGYAVSSLNTYQDVTVVCGGADEATYRATDVQGVVDRVTSVWDKVTSFFGRLWP